MAIQQLYGREHRSPSFAQSLGTGLGEGLSMLLSHRVADITRQKRAKEWESIGLPSNVAHFLVNQPESIQKDFLDRLEGFNIPTQEGEAPLRFGNKSSQSDKALVQKEIAQQKSIEPFLKGQAEDYNNAQKLYSKAKSMLKLINDNEKDWPGQLKGTLLPDQAYTNPHIRKYLSDANSLVTALANSRKGQPTGFKIKFEQLAKPNLSQPVETQKALLKDIIKESEMVFANQRLLNQVKRENGGTFPADIRSRLIEQGLKDQLDFSSSKSGEEFRGNFRKNDEGVVQKWNNKTSSYEDINPQGI
jgi:hypothetical protein